MLDSKKMLWTGTNTMIKVSVFTEINATSRLPEFFKTPGEFIILKIHSIWSRALSCTLVTIADLRYLQNSSVKLQNTLGTIAAKWTSSSIEPPFIESIAGFYPTSLCKKTTTKQPTQKLNHSTRHPLEEMKEKISEILKKPNEKWTLEDKFTMEHISKINH